MVPNEMPSSSVCVWVGMCVGVGWGMGYECGGEGGYVCEGVFLQFEN